MAVLGRSAGGDSSRARLARRLSARMEGGSVYSDVDFSATNFLTLGHHARR